MIDEIQKKILKKILPEKEALILKRLKEYLLVDENYNPNEENERRFPRIKVELHPGNIEKWYWNDGTKEGRLIITFTQTEYIPHIDFDNMNFQIKCGFNYK